MASSFNDLPDPFSSHGELAGDAVRQAVAPFPPEAVAARCGFASATRLGEALRRATGLTPTAWRRQAHG